MRLWSARISLLGRFAAMGVIVVVAVGLATDLVLKQQIERRALDRTVQDATVIAKLGVQQHPTRGLLAPDQFIPLAERTRAIADLTRWVVVDRALGQQRGLPLDEVKIDRSFVSGMFEDENDAVIVRSTIDLARNLRFAVVAEGVESAELMGELAALSCDIAQRFHISRPLPTDALAAWLQADSVSLRGPARNPSASSVDS
jgi:EAL domain-containing protein (putative c-di-GMP-specific phosphodiesterase class I)